MSSSWYKKFRRISACANVCLTCPRFLQQRADKKYRMNSAFKSRIFSKFIKYQENKSPPEFLGISLFNKNQEHSRGHSTGNYLEKLSGFKNRQANMSFDSRCHFLAYIDKSTAHANNRLAAAASLERGAICRPGTTAAPPGLSPNHVLPPQPAH